MRRIPKPLETTQRFSTGTRRQGFSTPWLAILLGLGVLSFFWFLSSLGPKKVDYSEIIVEEELSEEVKQLQLQSLELEAQFEEIVALREPQFKDLELLRRALELQSQYVDRLPAYSAEAAQREKNLNGRYDEYASQVLIEDSLNFERTARNLEEEGSFEAASRALVEALRLQKEINVEYPLSSAANPNRSTRLLRESRFLAAEPLARESSALEKTADLLIESEDWEGAELALVQAIQLQDRLNREFRGTKHDNVPRFEQLSTQLVAIRSGQSQAEIVRMANRADALQVEGETLEAAHMYQEVARLQRKLNETYPKSPYASSERVADFERKSQTSQSFDLGLEIEANHDRLRELLASRRTYEAAEVIVELRRGIQHLREVFPRSSLNNPQLELKVRYLNLIQTDLDFIQDRIYNALLPIPGVSDWQMTRTETSQALYSLIMGGNPSRNVGDLCPVDSVSWKDAKEFCERLGWIMGTEVRLPTEDEFRQALGRLRYVVLEAHVWGAADDKLAPQVVASKKALNNGFQDLLGNVSEWLESVDRFETEDAHHIGGHVQDRLDVLFTVPKRSTPRAGRSRLIGFRVVVKNTSVQIDS
ncbi:MAG: formylglycine-generating enzyme family protein [Opitutales bacterium]